MQSNIERKRQQLEEQKDHTLEFASNLERYNAQAQQVEEETRSLLELENAIDPEVYTDQYAAVEALEKQLVERIEELEKQRGALLQAWDKAVVETFAEYDTVMSLDPDIVIDDPLEALESRFVNLEQSLRGRTIIRLLSRAHRRKEQEVAAHRELFTMSKNERAAFALSSQTLVVRTEQEVRKRLDILRNGFKEKLEGQLKSSIREILQKREAVYALARNEEFRDKIDGRLVAEVIEPMAAQLRDPRVPDRDALIDQWVSAMKELLSHTINESLPEGDTRKTPDGKIAFNYGHHVHELTGAIQNTLPRKRDGFTYATPEDRERADLLNGSPESQIDASTRENPRDLTGTFLSLYADWRSRRQFEDRVAPYGRLTNVDYYKDRMVSEEETDVLRRDGHGWQQAFLDAAKAVGRWKYMVEDPEAAQHISAQERDEFEEYFMNILIEKILRPGGRESSQGSTANRMIEKLGSIRSLPRLMEYVIHAGSGHTSVNTFYVLKRMAQTPQGQEHIATLPSVQRKLFEYLIDEDSIIYRFGGRNVYGETSLLAQGEFLIAKEQLLDLFDSEMNEYGSSEQSRFIAGMLTPQEIATAFGKDRERVERTILESGDVNSWWTIPGLVRFLAKNKNFGKQLAGRVLQLGESQEKFVQLLGHKQVAKSAEMNEAMIQGLFSVRDAGEQGQQFAGTVLNLYTGAKDDPSRIRRVFRSMEMLQRFGVFDATYDPKARLSEVQKEIGPVMQELEPYWEWKKDTRRKNHELLKTLQSATDDTRRNSIERELQALNAELEQRAEEMEYMEERYRSLKTAEQAYTGGGLEGLVMQCQMQIAQTLAQVLGVEQRTAQRIAQNIETHTNSGLVDIATTLALSYSAARKEQPRRSLREFVDHVAEGDFAEWKYSHEDAEAQIGFLGDKKEQWVSNIPPVTIELSLGGGSEEDGRRSVLQAACSDAEQHVTEVSGELDGAVCEALKAHLAELTLLLADETTSPRRLRAQVEKLLRETEPKAHLNQARNDLREVLRIIDARSVGTVRAEEFDDPLRLVKMGSEPTATCQSWQRGSYNHCLLAYVNDANKKGINVVDEDNQAILRSVERVTESRQAGTDKHVRTLFVEPPYTLVAADHAYRAYVRLLLNKAEQMEAVLQCNPEKQRWTPQLLQILQEEVAVRGWMYEENAQREVYYACSRNGVEYSDSSTGGEGAEVHGANDFRPMQVIEVRMKPPNV